MGSMGNEHNSEHNRQNFARASLRPVRPAVSSRPPQQVKCVVQPSSAAAESFSIFSNSFTGQQEHALEDYIEVSVMSQYI